MSSKIVIKKPTTSSCVPKASAVVAVPSKVVVKAPSKVVVMAPQKVVAAPTKKAVAKIVHEEVEESDDGCSEALREVQDGPMTRDEMLAQALTLLSQALGMKGGSSKIKLTKSGKIRKPRGPRENSEKQSAWMDFVKQVREEQGVDENGKFVISHKDAMKMAKQLRAEAGEEAGSDHTEEADEAPAPTPKKVVAPKKAASATAKKSPQQIREEIAAAKKAAEAEAETETEVEVEEFEHDGKNYLKNTDNLCWLVDEEGNQTWAGVFLPEEGRIDETAEEPMA
jgi:hypothetical protein